MKQGPYKQEQKSLGTVIDRLLWLGAPGSPYAAAFDRALRARHLSAEHLALIFHGRASSVLPQVEGPPPDAAVLLSHIFWDSIKKSSCVIKASADTDGALKPAQRALTRLLIVLQLNAHNYGLILGVEKAAPAPLNLSELFAARSDDYALVADLIAGLRCAAVNGFYEAVADSDLDPTKLRRRVDSIVASVLANEPAKQRILMQAIFRGHDYVMPINPAAWAALSVPAERSAAPHEQLNAA